MSSQGAVSAIRRKEGDAVRSQRGQSIIEFAVILPFLLLLFLGIIYICLFFADYLTLNNVARSSVREASMLSKTTAADFNTIRQKYINTSEDSNDKTHLLTNLYPWKPAKNNNTDPAFQLKMDESSDAVVAEMSLSINKDFPGMDLYRYVHGSLPGNLEIKYRMYKEN